MVIFHSYVKLPEGSGIAQKAPNAGSGRRCHRMSPEETANRFAHRFAAFRGERPWKLNEIHDSCILDQFLSSRYL